MSRILILLMFVIWLGWKSDYGAAPMLGMVPSLAIFLLGYLLLVLGTGLWSRRLARRVSAPNFARTLVRFTRVVFLARIAVPLWFVVGVSVLGWWQDVHRLIDPGDAQLSQTVLGVLAGTLPPMLAWIGLWWSQYPAELVFREQSILTQLESDLPVHRPPSFRSYFIANLRLQLLFMVVPVLMIVALHDLIRLIAVLAFGRGSWMADPENALTFLLAAALVFFFAPEILRRILHTEPLANCPLRRRLELLCRRTGVRYRDILLWRTQNNVGNAAVMGFVPQLRYILLSDLLLETMTDEQIEAVFAHELGHIVHRHMAWLVVFMAVLVLFNIGGGTRITQWMSDQGIKDGATTAVVIGGAFVFKFLVLFGFVSRRFERQADVFAARTMEQSRASVPDCVASDLLLAARRFVPQPPRSADMTMATAASQTLAAPTDHVGQYGAAIFGSALHRVAIVNNIPVAARSWCHGSIATRMKYLHELSADPGRTRRFDRFMLCLYGALVFALFAGGAFCLASVIQ